MPRNGKYNLIPVLFPKIQKRLLRACLDERPSFYCCPHSSLIKTCPAKRHAATFLYQAFSISPFILFFGPSRKKNLANSLTRDTSNFFYVNLFFYFSDFFSLERYKQRKVLEFFIFLFLESFLKLAPPRDTGNFFLCKAFFLFLHFFRTLRKVFVLFLDFFRTLNAVKSFTVYFFLFLEFFFRNI